MKADVDEPMLFPRIMSPSDLIELMNSASVRELRVRLARVTEDKRPIWLVITGPSGCGKSSIASVVAPSVGIRTVLNTDYVASVANIESLFLNQPTCKVWQLVSDSPSDDAFDRGFRQIWTDFEPAVRRMMQSSKYSVQNLIIEGTHVDENRLQGLADEYRVRLAGVRLLAPYDRFVDEFIPARARSTFMHKSSNDYTEDTMRSYAALYRYWNDRPLGTTWNVTENLGSAVETAENICRLLLEGLTNASDL